MDDRFDALLAKSQKLSTQLGVNDTIFNEPLRRGIFELDVSKNLAFDGKSDLGEREKINAIKLLAQKNFDAVNLSSQVNEMAVESQPDLYQRLDGVSLEEYLSHHHDMVILNAIESSNRVTEDSLEFAKQSRLADEWSISRRNFIESLGHVTQHWNRTASSSITTSKIAASTYSNPSIPQLQPIVVTKPNTMMSLESGQQKLEDDSLDNFSEVVRQHITIIRSLHPKLGSSSQTSPRAPCIDLSEYLANLHITSTAAISLNDTGLTQSDLINYIAMIELLGNMVGERRMSAISRGFYTPICFSVTHKSSTFFLQNVLEKKQNLSLGALLCFQRQHLVLITQDVDECIKNGFIDSILPASQGNTRKQRLKSYVSYLWRCNELYDSATVDQKSISLSYDSVNGSRDGLYPVWAFVFFCICGGDLSAAVDELEQNLNNGVRLTEPEVITILRYFNKYKTIYSSNVSSGTNEPMAKILNDGEVKQLVSAITNCREKYECMLDESEQQSVDPYRLIVLNLCCLGDKQALADPGLPPAFYQLQTYLLANVWMIVFERWVESVIHSASSAFNSLISAEHGENWLYGAVLDYGGAAHFDPSQQNPLKYALVLLSCHRFGDAVIHLWHAGKGFAAAHLTSLSLHYGLILPHIPLSHNPPFLHGSLMEGHSNFSVPLGEGLTPSSLLQFFCSQPAQQVPEITVDYYLSIHTDGLKEIEREIDPGTCEHYLLRGRMTITSLFEQLLLSLNIDQLTRIVGQLPQEGKPSVGYLDTYWTRDQINSVIFRCAYVLLTSRHETEAAIYFYQLCGRFVDALDELCNQLSKQVTAKDSSIRSHWLNLSSQFYDKYVHNGTGPLSDAVLKEGRQDLIQLYLQLMNISLFASSCYRCEWNEAFSILDEIRLLPSSPAFIRTSMDMIQGLSSYSPILKLIDDLLIMAMDCVKNVYTIAHKESQSVILTVVQRNDRRRELESLKGRMQALVTLSSSLAPTIIKTDTFRTVALMESQLN